MPFLYFAERLLYELFSLESEISSIGLFNKGGSYEYTDLQSQFRSANYLVFISRRRNFE